MNLRIDADSLRLRLTGEDMARLLASGQVEFATPLPQGLLTVPVDAGQHWRLDGSGLYLALEVPREQLAAEQAKPSRDGLGRDMALAAGQVTVSLAVDLKNR